MSKSAAAVAAAQSGWGALGASANPEAFAPPPEQASTVEPDLPVPTPVKEKEAKPATRPKPGSQKEKVLSVPTASPRSVRTVDVCAVRGELEWSEVVDPARNPSAALSACTCSMGGLLEWRESSPQGWSSVHVLGAEPKLQLNAD